MLLAPSPPLFFFLSNKCLISLHTIHSIIYNIERNITFVFLAASAARSVRGEPALGDLMLVKHEQVFHTPALHSLACERVDEEQA